MHMVALGPVLVVPSGHMVQLRSVVSVFVGGTETICPLGQSVHGVQAVASTLFVKPLSQCLHVASIVELPVIETKNPGEHTESAVHIAASSVVLKVPLGQGLQTGRILVPPAPTKKPALQLHTLSCCVVPGPVCVSPAGHEVNGVHAVAPALALNVPSAHVRQSLSFVEVPCANRN
jgi:hypothetical protein